MIFGEHVTLLPQVWRQSFWMRGWGSRTPKRTSLWSNSYAIRKFQTASKFSRAVKAGAGIELADVYYDKAGRKRYKGNKRLKQSQSDTQFTICIHQLLCQQICIIYHGIYGQWLSYQNHPPREYPVGYGIRFAHAMKYFLKERSPMKNVDTNVIQRKSSIFLFVLRAYLIP